MMAPIFLKLKDTEGNDEAEISRYQDGTELPPGKWLVTYNSGEQQIAQEILMPVHWKTQIEQATRFGEQLP